MTRILNFSVRNDARLRCVWIETGNPARPLACKWTSGLANAEGAADLSNEPRHYRHVA